ncbi:MAG: hypothetical protein ABJD68_09055 [Nakamurella sp.]
MIMSHPVRPGRAGRGVGRVGTDWLLLGALSASERLRIGGSGYCAAGAVVQTHVLSWMAPDDFVAGG